MRWFVPRTIRHARDDSSMTGNEQDLTDDDLPGDDAPPEIELVPTDRQPDDPPPDEGNVDAERKEATNG